MAHQRFVLIGLLASVGTAPLYAQQVEPIPPAPAAPRAGTADPQAPLPEDATEEGLEGDPEEEDREEIVVTGQRERGAVIGDIPPEIQLDARDIRALGAGSIAEVLDALGPQTRSGRGRGEGRPIVLLNGKRISGFREIRNIPPEAIQRVDILPEEVALRYGYRADQRVVNFVLRRRFRALTGEVGYGFATDGGRDRQEADLNLLRIDRTGRWELDFEYEHDAPLLESERDLDTEFGQFRTLLPRSDQLSLSGTLNRTVFDDVDATVNATFEAGERESRFGLANPELARALRREVDSRDGHLGISLNGNIRPWRWSFTANYDRGHSVTRTDRRGEFDIRDRAESRSEVANAAAVFNGSLLDLPAGDVSATLRAGAERQGLESEANRLGIIQRSDLSRTIGSAQANLDLPIASRRRDVLAGIGNLSANLNAEVERYSDFGTLTTIGYGLNWSPIAQVTLIASVTEEEGAPSVQQLGNPVISTPNVRVFDFTRGESGDVTRIEGGNPDLLADDRRVLKLGVTVRPLSESDLSLTANHTDTRILDAIASFPTTTSEIEAAFPDRFQHDGAGRLLRIDSRPVNFQRTDREELRWGINFSKPIASARPPRGAFPQRWRRRDTGADSPDVGAATTPPPAGAAGAPGAPPQRQPAATTPPAEPRQGAGPWRLRWRPFRRRARRPSPVRPLSHLAFRRLHSDPPRGAGTGPSGRLSHRQSRWPAAPRNRSAGRHLQERFWSAGDRRLAKRHRGARAAPGR